jgi:hypothetical protein
MIERTLIHVTGPRGAGKTTLIAHVLRRAGRLVAAARCIRDDALRVPKESAPKGHAELKAYRAAGADPVALYRFPASHADWDAFCTTNLMTDYFEAVLLEGALPVEWVDLTVYVAPPGPDGGSLLMATEKPRPRPVRRAGSLAQVRGWREARRGNGTRGLTPTGRRRGPPH